MMVRILSRNVVNDSDCLKLLASFEAVLGTAERSLSIARALAAGYRSGVHPPDVVLEAYSAAFERDEAQLAELRDKIQHFRNELELQAAES